MHDGSAPLGTLAETGVHTVLADVAELLLAAVTVADVQRLLHTCPRRYLREILRQVGLPDAKRVTERAAESVLRTLQTGEPGRRRRLRTMLGWSHDHDFGNCDGLTAADCCALLDPDRAETVLVKAPVLATGLAWEWPDPILRWGIARVAALDRPLAPVALGLLAGEPDALGEGGRAVASAWQPLCERHPELPERPISLARIRELARRRPSAPSPSDEETHVTTEAATGPTAQEVADALGELRDDLPAAADAADRIARELRAGRRPGDDDLRLITEVTTTFDTVRGQVEALSPGAEPAADVDVLSAALDTAREAEARSARIRPLLGIQGPEVVAEELDEIRRMARAGTGDGLEALAELIEVTSGPDDDLKAPRLAQQARDLLPERCRTLVDVALMGKLKLGPPPPESDEDPEPPDPPTPPEAPTPKPPASDALAELDDLIAETFPTHPGDTDTPPTENAPPSKDHAPTNGNPPTAYEAPAENKASAHDPVPVHDHASAAGKAPGAGGLPAKGDAPAEGKASAPANDNTSPDDYASVKGDASAKGEVPIKDKASAKHSASTEDDAAGEGSGRGGGPVRESGAAAGGLAAGGQGTGLGEASSGVVVRQGEPGEGEAAADGVGEAGPQHASVLAGVAPEVVAAEAAALRGGRFGVAGRLRTAVGRPAAEEAARRCAAIAAEMATFAGPLSAEFAAAAREVNVRALADDPAGRLLAWAAAVRAGLVHPTPESTRLVEELTVVFSGLPGLVECGTAFVRAARGGAYLGGDAAGRVRGAAESGLARRQAVREASRLLVEEPHRKIKYQFATEVWKAMLQPDGPVGRLLGVAAEDDPERVDRAADDITRLRAGGEIDRLIDETTRRLAGRRNKKIIAGARLQLVSKIETALDTVGEWVRAVKEARDAQSADASDWRLGPLGQLQEALGGHRSGILAAFDDLASAPDELSAAAAEAARGLVVRTLDLLDGAALPGTEPPVAQVVNRDLLLAPEISLDPATLEPLEPPAVEHLASVAFAADDAWRAAFEARAARGDHEGTRSIITVLERRDPRMVADLRERRDELIASARRARDARIEEIRDLVARWVRDGALTETEVRRAEEILGSLTGGRRDFDRIDRSLDELRDRLEGQRRAGIERERARLEQSAAENPRVAAVQDRIRERVDQGDLTTAREFLAQVEAGNELPETDESVDHLRRFHPAFCGAFAGAVRVGGRVGKQDGVEFLTLLKSALRAGREVEDPGLAEAMRTAGIDVPALRMARREESLEGIRQWQACGNGSKTAGNLRTAIESVLRMIGLEGVQRDVPGIPRGPHRIWIDLEQVRVVGEALLPAFGSRMSPSGDRLRLVLVWRRPGPQQLIEMLKGQPEDQTVLVWYFGVLSPDERQQLAAAARRRPAPVAGVLDDAAISYLACLPEADWATAVALMAPFTATNPYAPVGDVPDEMFYGRADQLREVTDRAGSSFVYGGRQLGKSALLRKAERHIRATDQDRTVILENVQNIGKVAPLASLWSKLADKLAQAGVLPAGLVHREQVCDGVRAWVGADSRRQVLILLDEADHFLNEDAKGARFENVIALRDLMNETRNRVKVVFAGLHQTARFQSLTNQPLAHLGTPIAVGPLEPQNAFDLLVRPLATLGFRFPEQLAARVIAEANNAPALVQLFAEELLKRLRRGSRAARPIPYEITGEDVAEVWRDKTLARGFRDRFEWTLNLDKRYKVIAYTVALQALTEDAAASLGVGDLWEQCRYWWKEGFEDCTSDGFRSLLEECVNLGVLGLDVDGYRLRTPHILNLLGGTAEVEEVLENAADFEQPDSFDAYSYHGTYQEGPERSPLSSRQISTLFRPHDLVHVVTGSRALHVKRVAHALEAEETVHPGVRVHLVCQGRLTFEGAVQRAAGHEGHTLIVVKLPEGKTRQQFRPRLEEALAAVSAQHRGTLAVVLVTGPDLACVWRDLLVQDGIDVVQLRRFDRLAIRQWMWEESYGFTDEAGQDALLAVTGGWPTLIGQVVNRIHEHGADRDVALRHCREYLRRSAAQFVAETGVLADECLAAAWRVLVAEDAPEPAGYLADLLDLHAEEVAALCPEALEEHGYGGTADLVEALRLLGALEPREGRLACEPVLAGATRAMDESR
ncbi:MAG TPA: ATP-binding protein [Thermomonospora sp.]|nr:ATP-binding protein [Thermomonospora sp.]